MGHGEVGPFQFLDIAAPDLAYQGYRGIIQQGYAAQDRGIVPKIAIPVKFGKFRKDQGDKIVYGRAAHGVEQFKPLDNAESRSLSHFVYKTSKNRLQGDFLSCKLRKHAGQAGFLRYRWHKNPQAQQAASH
jgi:hypothetical protein